MIKFIKKFKFLLAMFLLLIFAIWIGGAFLSQSHMQMPSCHSDFSPIVCPVIQYSSSLWQQISLSLIFLIILLLVIVRLFLYLRHRNIAELFEYLLKNISLRTLFIRRAFFSDYYLREIYSSGKIQNQTYQ